LVSGKGLAHFGDGLFHSRHRIASNKAAKPPLRQWSSFHAAWIREYLEMAAGDDIAAEHLPNRSTMAMIWNICFLFFNTECAA